MSSVHFIAFAKQFAATLLQVMDQAMCKYLILVLTVDSQFGLCLGGRIET